VLNEQLHHALNSRIVIEQAKGMVAESERLNMEEAFSMLRRHARNHNLRLAAIPFS
jgi:AmiR/NasT family two-component response regulator